MTELKIASISDIHLGNRKNPTVEIIKNLKTAFPDNLETADLDIIFIVGDVFDDLLNLSDSDVWEIKLWIAGFLRTCKKHDITVVVLEGTPSHDWRQSELFLNTNAVADIGANLRYVKTLSIEYIERYGITVLCVPDEIEPTTEKTLSQVHELLRAKGLDKVDYAIMHGQFEYQLPAHVKAQKHDSEAYLKIVKHLIFIGHVHTYSRYKRIIAQGSFDRIGHGQEEAKGHVRATVRKNGDYDIVFVENLNAKCYVTVDCVGLELAETLALIDKKVSDLPIGSLVRVKANENNPIFENMEIVIRKHPCFTWSKDVTKTKEEEQTLVDEGTVYVPVALTRENIPNLLMERLINSGVSNEVLEAAKIIIKEAL